MRRFRARTSPARAIHDVIGIRNAMQRMANTEGLRIVEEPGCKQPRTNLERRVVFVEPLDPYWSEARMAKWRGEVAHEIGHHSDRCGDTLAMMKDKGLGFDSLMGKIINILDDVRNEKYNLGMWPGRDSDLSWTQAFYCTQGYHSLSKVDASTLIPDQRLFAEVLGWCYETRSRWQPDLAIPATDFVSLLDITDYNRFTDELDAMETAEDVYNLARKLIDADPDHDADEEEAKAKANEAAGGEGDEEGEGAGKGDESDDSDSDAEGEGAGKEDSDDGGPGKGVFSYKDLMGHKHTDPEDREATKDTFMRIEYDHEPGVYLPSPQMKVEKARDMTRVHEGTRSEIEEMVRSGRSLAGTARRIFQSRMQSSVVHNQKRGRLDKRDFYRIPTGSVDVFKRKVDAIDPKGTALFILTDASGSMAGHKFQVTAAAVALLNEAVNPLGVPTYIAAFSETRSTGPHHMIAKEFDEHRRSEDIITDYTKMIWSLKQNADGESIMWAANILKQRKEPRKILLVLSDGQPAADNPGDCWTYTKDAIAHVSKMGIECYGVGIMDETVKDLYPEYTLIKDVEQLEKGLLDIIKAKIF